MFLTELPYNLPGRIFSSVMPFGYYDPDGDSLIEFKAEGIQIIVLLVEEQEYLRIAGLNLLALYRKKGFEVIHLPIKDLGVPPREDLNRVVDVAIEHAKAGQNIVVHCHAGIGRTGLFLSYLAMKVLHFSGEDAINWVRKYIPRAVQSEEQRRFLVNKE